MVLWMIVVIVDSSAGPMRPQVRETGHDTHPSRVYVQGTPR